MLAPGQVRLPAFSEQQKWPALAIRLPLMVVFQLNKQF